MIDAKEAHDIATMDIPNAFIQMDIPYDKGQERIILKIHGALVDMLLQIDPGTYALYVSYKCGEKILYTDILKAIYRMLISALMFYKNGSKICYLEDTRSISMILAFLGKLINGKQHTIVRHVDNLNISHVNPKVNNKFVK